MPSLSPEPQQQTSREFFGDEDLNIAYSRVWFYVTKTQRKFYAKISHALKSEGLGDPLWYEILFEIDQAGLEGKLMGEIEPKLLVPQYTLSRQVSRMESAGLIYREYIADGRRKQILFATDLGKERLQQVWPIYLETLKTEMGALISTDEAYDIARSLLRLIP